MHIDALVINSSVHSAADTGKYNELGNFACAQFAVSAILAEQAKDVAITSMFLLDWNVKLCHLPLTEGKSTVILRYERLVMCESR